MIDYQAVGQRIRYNRNKFGLTQEQLAEKIDVSVPHISRIENGTSQPSLQVLVDLCNALDITIDGLMQDSLAAARLQKEHQLHDLLSNCTSDELSMIYDLVETLLGDIRRIYRK